jgi:hypothetical protein
MIKQLQAREDYSAVNIDVDDTSLEVMLRYLYSGHLPMNLSSRGGSELERAAQLLQLAPTIMQAIRQHNITMVKSA